MRQGSLKTQGGFTLVEALIGVLILGIVIMAGLSLNSFTSSTVKKVTDFSATQKVLITIVNDILTNEKGLPPAAPPAALARATVTQTELAQAFEAMPSKKSVCYDRRAVLVTIADPMCFYRVRYFKYRVDDRSFPANSELSRIPLARVVVQVAFQDPDAIENRDANPSNDVYRTRYMTRLVSNVADY